MNVYCTICCKLWNASKYTVSAGDVCPHCQWKMDRGIKIKLGRRKEYGKAMQNLCV